MVQKRLEGHSLPLLPDSNNNSKIAFCIQISVDWSGENRNPTNGAIWLLKCNVSKSLNQYGEGGDTSGNE